MIDVIYLVHEDPGDPDYWGRLKRSVLSIRLGTNQDYTLGIADTSVHSRRQQLDALGIGPFEYTWAPQEGIYNRSFNINVGVRHFARGTYILCSDSDIIYNRHHLSKCLGYAREGYDYLTISMYKLEQETQGHGWETLRGVQGTMVEAGGGFWCTRSFFEKVRGFDERYVGWGSEDCDFTDRVIAAGAKAKRWIKDPFLVHLRHRSRQGDPDIAKRNLGRLLEVREKLAHGADPADVNPAGWGAPYHRHVQIQTTANCNAQCVMCPRPKAMKGRMSNKTFDETVGALLDSGISIRKLAPYMQAEPFCDKAFPERLRTLLSVFDPEAVEVSSNCLKMPKKALDGVCEALGEASCRKVLVVSFHGLNEAEHRRIMGVSWRRNLANALRLLKATDETDIERWIYASGPSVAEVHDFWRTQCASLKVPPRIKVFNPNNRAREGLTCKPDNRRCHRLTDWLHINKDGKVIICCNDYDWEVVLGDIRKQPLNEIMDGIPAVFEKFTDPEFICNRCDRLLV